MKLLRSSATTLGHHILGLYDFSTQKFSVKIDRGNDDPGNNIKQQSARRIETGEITQPVSHIAITANGIKGLNQPL